MCLQPVAPFIPFFPSLYTHIGSHVNLGKVSVTASDGSQVYENPVPQS